MPGVNVLVKGTPKGTSTDFDGKFQLTKISKGAQIVFSLIGYKVVTIDYSNQKTIDVVLQEEANQLNEVVVQVGYGSIKKKDATGSVAVLSAKDFNKGAITNTENLINGRIAGVTVTQGGRPGDGAAIRIRGGASLNASNDPLVVIDGLPVDKGLSSINPNDIESFSILKDASAAAIYGSRGSNGVVIIKTKKGSKQGGPSFTFNTMTTVNSFVSKVSVYNANEFRNLITTYIPNRVPLLGTSNTDWQNVIFKDGITSDNFFSYRDNLFKVLPTRLSFGYTKINGVLQTSMFDRKTVGLSMNPSFFDDHLKIDINANYAYEKNNYADEGAIGSAISYDPTQAIYDSNSPFGGYREWYTAQPTAGMYTVYGPSNPLALLQQKINVGRNNRYYGNIQAEYKFPFFEDLKAVVNVGLDSNRRNGINTTSYEARSGMYDSRLLGYNENTWGKAENKLLDYYLNYSKKTGKTKFDLTTGYSYQNFEENSFYSGNTLRVGSASDVYTSPGVNLQAFYTRLNMDFDSKYLITLNYRHDGTSRFSEKNRWGNFPGVAVAWKLKNEPFLKNTSTISDLKMRLGWGIVGQQNTGAAYEYFKRYNLSGPNSGAMYQFGDVLYYLGKPEGYNENLRWEKTTTTNVGFDFGLFNDKLTGNIDFYNKITTDLYAIVEEGALQNFRTQGGANIGKLSSKGVELGFAYKAIQSTNSNLTFNYNISYNKLKIENLDKNEYFSGGIGLDVYAQIMKEGLAPSTFWLYEQVYDVNGYPIEGVYVDRNGDGQITSADKHAYKKPNADVTMGFMTTYNYKKWDFSMAWRTSLGNYIYDNVNSSRAFLSQSISDNNVNAVNNAPVDFSNTLFSQKRAESDYYVKDGSWLKCDNITIGYLMNNPMGTKASSMRLSLGIQNVLTITKYKGMDPEIFGGIDSTIYPRARMYMFGVNLNF